MYQYHLAIDIGASSGRHILAHLEDGKMARTFEVPDDDDAVIWFKGYNLLTAKPVIFAANVEDSDLADDGASNENVAKVREYAATEGFEVFVVCAQIEQEISELDDDEKSMFLEDLGLSESGLEKLIHSIDFLCRRAEIIRVDAEKDPHK